MTSTDSTGIQVSVPDLAMILHRSPSVFRGVALHDRPVTIYPDGRAFTYDVDYDEERDLTEQMPHFREPLAAWYGRRVDLTAEMMQRSNREGWRSAVIREIVNLLGIERPSDERIADLDAQLAVAYAAAYHHGYSQGVIDGEQEQS